MLLWMTPASVCHAPWCQAGRACKKKRSFFFSIHVEFKSCFAFVQNALRCEIPCLPTKHKRHFTVCRVLIFYQKSHSKQFPIQWSLAEVSSPEEATAKLEQAIKSKEAASRVVSSWKRFNTKALEVPQIGADLFKPLKPRGLGLHRFSHD